MRDPGLQSERTALAWRRTALSAAVVGALLVKVHYGPAVAVSAVAIGLWWTRAIGLAAALCVLVSVLSVAAIVTVSVSR